MDRSKVKILVRSPKQFGDGIRRFRQLAGLTQAELAEKSVLWQETVSKIERQHEGVKFKSVCRLLAALDLELILQPRTKGSVRDMEDIFS